MPVMKIFEPIMAHKNLALVTFLSTVALMATAYFYPITWIGNVNIRNSEKLFSIPTLKVIKANMPSQTIDAVNEMADIPFKNFLKKTILDESWIEKNIKNTYALTKVDARELVDANLYNDKIVMSRYSIVSVDVELANKDKKLVKDAAAWITKYLVDAAYREEYINLLSDIRQENEDKLKEIFQKLPKWVLEREAVSEKLLKTREIFEKNPQMFAQGSETQFSLSAPKDGTREHFNYLPLKTLLAGLEIEQKELETNIEHARFEIEVREDLLAWLNQALTEVLSKSTLIFSREKIELRPLWKSNLYSDVAPDKKNDQWKRSYVKDIEKEIETRKLIINEHHVRQLNERELVFIKHKYKRWVLLLISLLVGLLVPSLIYFFPKYYARLKKF